MKHEQLEQISEVQADIKEARRINTGFLTMIKQYPLDASIPAQVSTGLHSLQVDCFSYSARSTPRIVLSAKNLISMEYVFFVDHGDQQIEVARFYLRADGFLGESVESHDAPTFSRYDEPTVPNEVCSRVILGVLESSLFKTTPEAR